MPTKKLRLILRTRTQNFDGVIEGSIIEGKGSTKKYLQPLIQKLEAIGFHVEEEESQDS